MDRISAQEKSDQSLNARSLHELDLLSPFDSKETRELKYKYKYDNDEFQLPIIKNKSSLTGKHILSQEARFDNRSNAESNETFNNRQSSESENKIVLLRKPYAEFSKNISKLSSILLSRDIKSEGFSMMSYNSEEKHSSESNASNFVEVFKRHKENSIDEELEKDNSKSSHLRTKDIGKRVREQNVLV